MRQSSLTLESSVNKKGLKATNTFERILQLENPHLFPTFPSAYRSLLHKRAWVCKQFNPSMRIKRRFRSKNLQNKGNAAGVHPGKRVRRKIFVVIEFDLNVKLWSIRQKFEHPDLVQCLKNLNKKTLCFFIIFGPFEHCTLSFPRFFRGSLVIWSKNFYWIASAGNLENKSAGK